MRTFANPIACVPALLCALGLTACGPERTVFGSGDVAAADATDAAMDAAPEAASCPAGAWYCAGAVARQCDGRGGYQSEQDCQAMGLSCVPAMGCRVCTPGGGRCDPSRPDQTQQCDATGSRWIDGPRCDAARGQMCTGGSCSSRCDRNDRGYLACDYFATVSANPYLMGRFDFAVVVANPQEYPVAVGVTGGALGGATESRTLAPGQVQTIVLPWVDALVTPGTEARAVTPGGAYHIETDGPVAAYQFNPLHYRDESGSFSHTNDASLLLPTQALTSHYTLSSWPGGALSVVGVDGGETPTHVTVRHTARILDPTRPHAGTFGAWPALPPGTFTADLRQGDVLQLQAENTTQDLTGTVIEATRPVAVFTTHPCAGVPTGRLACDHLEEQQFPNETWGRRYVVTPTRDRGPDVASVVRLVSQRDGNVLAFDGIAAPPACAAPLAAGQACEFTTTRAFAVEGTQPLLATQLMIGQGPLEPQCADEQHVPLDDAACWGDPSMALEVPIEQYRRAYDVLVPDSYVRNFVNVVVASGADVRLDGAAVTGTREPAGAGFELLYFEIAPGPHHLESADGARAFAIKVYGVAPYTSYMYPGGLDLAPISPPG